jgi:solute carrier family 39 (zinc transporter), member 9
VAREDELRRNAVAMAAPGVIAVSVLSFVMFVASFGAGIVPLVMSLNRERVSIVSSIGVGLLVGTSLGVVLPEGIEMLYTLKASPSTSHHQLLQRQEHVVPGVIQSPHADVSFRLAIALALVMGYLVMHLLTFLPPLLLARDPQSPIPLASLPSSPRLERIPSGPSIADPPTGLSNTTIGLCIHALADGIALGSSALSNNVALEGIVFFAIMLHKVTLFLNMRLIFRHQHHSPSRLYLFENPTLVILVDDSSYYLQCPLHYRLSSHISLCLRFR